MCMPHFFAVASLLFTISEALLVQDLGGDKWTAWNENQSIRISSRVPGSIYSDLERAHAIENIYDNFNDIKYRWVSYQNWTFARHFDVSSDVLSMEQVYLVCHGLDTIAQIYVNGHLLGTTDNMFVRYRWPMRTLLRSQQNIIQVRFLSAPHYAKEYYIRTMREKYIIPPVCTPRQQNGECHVNFVRKMQSSFSWDWGPAFPTQGIWRPIEIEAYRELRLRTVSVSTQQDHTGQWLLNCTVFVEGAPGSGSRGNMSLYLNESLLSKSEFIAHFDPDGETALTAFVLVPTQFAIKAWFPNGMGAQHLYPLTVKIATASEFANKTVNIGFRTIRLVQDRLPSSVEAYSFYFEVNGLPIYSKGSNWIPAHVLHESYTLSYVEDLLLSAKLANMNMLRVWGGGIYEDDRFYELADQYGILIWHDMMFACALYPTDSQFLRSVSSEVRQQIRRLQHHPSIALWAGNNENEAAIAGFWWPELILHLDEYEADYRTLYINTIMPIALQEDRTRTFLPSSPSNGIVSPRDNYTSPNPQSSLYGDVHFYEVGKNAWQWQIYPSAKFVSEYGFQSWSSLTTLQQYIAASSLRYPLDDTLQHREHQVKGLDYLSRMITDNLPLPSNGSIARLDDYIYLSQVHQAMAIKIQTEFYRRNRQVNDNGQGLTLGALYWQLNDIWPTVSWASIEFGGKWKMLHYFVRNIFNNLLVDVYEENDMLKVAIVRDDHIQQSIPFQVNIEVFSWSWTAPILTQRLQALTKPFSVTLAFEHNTATFLQRAHCRDRNGCFVQVTISSHIQDKFLERKNFLLLGKIKDAIGLQKAHIRVSNIRGPAVDSMGVNTFQIHLESDRVAPFVWLDFATNSTVRGIFSDNGFIMTNQTLVTFKTRENISKIRLNNSMVIKSLKDVQ